MWGGIGTKLGEVFALHANRDFIGLNQSREDGTYVTVQKNLCQNVGRQEVSKFISSGT